MTQQIQDIGQQAFVAIGGRDFSRIAIMVDAPGTPFGLEVNTLPGLTDLSDLPAQAAAAGITYDELISEILVSAQTRG